MSGDVANVSLWATADVYVSFALDTAEPADIDADFPVGWDFVGLLDGDDGFTEGREEDENDHFAWGGIYEGTSLAHFKLFRTFACHEDNDETFRLVWPGSTRGGDIVKPVPENVLIAWETNVGDKKERWISANYAQVRPDGDRTWNETDITKLPLRATLFPDTSGDAPVYYHHQTTETGS